MNTIVDWGGFTVTFIVTRWTEVEGGNPELGAAGRFLEAFKQAGEKYRVPAYSWTGEDYGIANRLVKKHGQELLLKLAPVFWSLFSDPLLGSTAPHPMRLFAASISDIARQIGVTL